MLGIADQLPRINLQHDIGVVRLGSMKWVIVILMCCKFMPHEKDAIEIDGYAGKPLVFTRIDRCQAHVKQNYVMLSLFAQSRFPGKAVKSIHCFERSEI